MRLNEGEEFKMIERGKSKILQNNMIEDKADLLCCQIITEKH